MYADLTLVKLSICRKRNGCHENKCETCITFEKMLDETKCELSHLCRLIKCDIKHEDCYIRFCKDTMEPEEWNMFKNKLMLRNSQSLKNMI